MTNKSCDSNRSPYHSMEAAASPASEAAASVCTVMLPGMVSEVLKPKKPNQYLSPQVSRHACICNMCVTKAWLSHVSTAVVTLYNISINFMTGCFRGPNCVTQGA